MWEKYRAYSPYNYSGNNPMVLKDPSGFGWWSDRVQNAKDIGNGIVDGVLSDWSGEDVRTGDQNSDLYRAAKFGTHVANLYLSAEMIVTGHGLVTLGIVGAPETLGGSLAVSASGVTVIALGTKVGVTAMGNLMKSQANSSSSSNSNSNIPQKAYDAVDYAKKKNGTAQPGYKGNKPFTNDGRDGGQVLPKQDAKGNTISYKEYDVNPYKKGVNRGKERVVIGSDGKAYYTDNHYITFQLMQ